MKTSIVSYTFSKFISNKSKTQDDFIEFCSWMQVDGVELFDMYVDGENPDERYRSLLKSRTLLDKYNLSASCYMLQNNFTPGENIDENLKLTERALDEALLLGAPCVRILGGYTDLLKGITREAALKEIIISLKRAVEIAERKGVVLALENHGDLPGTSAEVLHVIKTVNSPMLRACIDLGNFLAGNMAVKESPRDALKKLLEYVVHVHVKDRRFLPGSRGDVEACIVGTGAVDLQECMNILAEYGYSGYISCESDGEAGIDCYTSILNSIANIKTAVEKAKK
jgi:sugar phosphate isomerase/epimerase